MYFVVSVAQLVERRIVVPVVGGSNPLAHPMLLFETLDENENRDRGTLIPGRVRS